MNGATENIGSPDVAWLVTVAGLECVVFAPNRSRAKWKAVESYRDAGYGRRGEWPSLSVGRAERFDGKEPTGGLQASSRCYSESYLERP